ncbi:flagellar protein FlaG [Thermomonas paludicola]|uniref:flagellar protein FlaG n=1 Tax=Thermomonas paludicola TaxID=2884874 RepID=UPI002113A2A0|nr:flagellar protein FlaG [Thermomonas paludicola]
MSSIAPVNASIPEARKAPTPAAGALSRPTTTPVAAPGGNAKSPSPAIATATSAAAEAAVAANQAKKERAAEELQKQLDEAMSHSTTRTSLRFRVDDEAHRIVVSVVDSDSGKTIAQIPDETALALARRLAETGSGLLDQHA